MKLVRLNRFQCRSHMRHSLSLFPSLPSRMFCMFFNNSTCLEAAADQAKIRQAKRQVPRMVAISAMIRKTQLKNWTIMRCYQPIVELPS